MKKVLPIIILIFGVLAVVGVILFVRSKNTKNKKNIPDQEETVPAIALEKRPVVSLTPSSDGHWLKLKIQKIVIDAASLDYELTYKVPDGRTQGVPGTVKLTTKDDIEKDLLLGSESSGKFRYDEGVENGQVVFRFRDSNGKLVAKFSTEFHLQTKTDTLTTQDGNFEFDLFNSSNDYFITMPTIGRPDGLDKVVEEPYGVFSSTKDWLEGELKEPDGEIYYFGGKEWSRDGVPQQIPGIFVKLS